jgi:uncharacterized membrane protein YGL010W
MPSDPPPDLAPPQAGDFDGAYSGAHLRRVDKLFGTYSESHRHPINRLIHWLCVPVVYWTVLALLSALPFPNAMRVPGLDWGLVGALAVVLYIVTLSPRLAVGMAVISIASLMLAAAYRRWGEVPLWQFALFVFALAWVVQLVGHKIEGRRPSFFRDLQFLLIGPAWLLAKVYRLIGLKY